MIQELISLVRELFPSIKPYTAEQALIALKQFELSGKTFQHFFYSPFDHLAQGDVIGDVPFVQYTASGDKLVYKTKGLLISNTCSADHDEQVVLAPLIPLEEISEEDKPSIIKNKIYRLLYFPDQRFSEYAVDLSLMNAYPTKLIKTGLERGNFEKVASLNSLGYYILLTKLTVHFMRPEDEDVQRFRLERYEAV
jgi:hypothetical protein